MRELAKQAVFGEDNSAAKEEIKRIAIENGIFLSSIQGLYEEMASGQCGGFTVPAFNLKTLTFDMARALFRSARKQNVGAFIVEIAKSEIEYTDQTPEEYTACCLAGAIEEGFQGPLFLQGDHFKCHKNTPECADGLKALIAQAMEAGFYNIDIDLSALPEKHNVELLVCLISFIRSRQSNGLVVSIGGEIGEIGGENTTIEQVERFLESYKAELGKLGNIKGLSKLAVQTGTSHGKGGVVDFYLLEELGKLVKENGLAGVVQHGASTLDDNQFKKFTKLDVCEIHLATEFLNIILKSNHFPKELKQKIHSKKDLGPLKKEIWDIEQVALDGVIEELEQKFSFFFEKLKVKNTTELVRDVLVV